MARAGRGDPQPRRLPAGGGRLRAARGPHASGRAARRAAVDRSRRAHPGRRGSRRARGELVSRRWEQGHVGIDTLTYAVSHRTVLRYTAKVSLSYNEVRMRPRDRGSQRTLAFSLTSTPWAVPRRRVDYFGNFVHRVDVAIPHKRLEFAVDAVVESGEPRRRRLAAWEPDALGGDPRPEVVLPGPRAAL